jgi:hypothetical protein
VNASRSACRPFGAARPTAGKGPYIPGPVARRRSKPLPLGSRSCRSRALRAYHTPEGRQGGHFVAFSVPFLAASPRRLPRRRGRASGCEASTTGWGLSWCHAPSGESWETLGETLGPTISAVTTQDALSFFDHAGYRLSKQTFEKLFEDAARVP